MPTQIQPECFSLAREFRFNEPSRGLRDIKFALLRGIALEISVIDDISDDYKLIPELFVLYFHETSQELLARARTRLGVTLSVIEHQCITMLGTDEEIAQKIHRVLEAESVIYLIPECTDSYNVTGHYTLLLLNLFPF